MKKIRYLVLNEGEFQTKTLSFSARFLSHLFSYPLALILSLFVICYALNLVGLYIFTIIYLAWFIMVAYKESRIYIVDLKFISHEVKVVYQDFSNVKEFVFPFEGLKVKFYDSVKGGLFSPSLLLENNGFKLKQFAIGIYSRDLVDSLYQEIVKRMQSK